MYLSLSLLSEFCRYPIYIQDKQELESNPLIFATIQL